VIPNRPRKSLSVEQTFAINLSTREEIQSAIDKIYAQFIQRISDAKISAPIKSQFIKIKFANWQQITRETSSHDHQLAIFHQLFSAVLNESLSQPIRLLGLGISFDLQEDLLVLQPELF
jgi:DNA polymerase-4